jgi:glycerate 2-kinase
MRPKSRPLREYTSSVNDFARDAEIRAELMRFYRAAVAAVDPSALTARALDGTIPGCDAIASEIGAAPRIVVIAIGKASAAMAFAIERRLDGQIADGIAVIPDAPAFALQLTRIRPMAGGHPMPTAASEASAREAMAMLARTAPGDLVIVAISGGASAMFAAPADGVTLEDKVAITSAMLKSPASIREINAVRKHLSCVKGGQLARAARGARIISLILSDVTGNDLATIGSGPTIADGTTFSEAIAVLKRRNIWGRAPERVREHLERGVAGEVPDTPKSGDPAFVRATAAVIGDNAAALDAAARCAADAGWRVERWRALEGEAEDLGRELANALASISAPRVCVLAGGEPVVTVRGGGRGGRAQQAALAMALEMERVAPERRIAAMLAGTDGIDGPTDAAGGFAFPSTVARAAARELDPQGALRRNDAYNLLDGAGDLIRTGATGTNVSDIFIGFANY